MLRRTCCTGWGKVYHTDAEKDLLFRCGKKVYCRGAQKDVLYRCGKRRFIQVLRRMRSTGVAKRCRGAQKDVLYNCGIRLLHRC